MTQFRHTFDYVSKHAELGQFEDSSCPQTWLEISEQLAHEASQVCNFHGAAHIYELCTRHAEELWSASSLHCLDFRRAYADHLLSLHRYSDAIIILSSIQGMLEQSYSSADSLQRDLLQNIFVDVAHLRFRAVKGLYKRTHFAAAVEASLENLDACRCFLGDDHKLTRRAESERTRCQQKWTWSDRQTKTPCNKKTSLDIFYCPLWEFFLLILQLLGFLRCMFSEWTTSVI